MTCPKCKNNIKYSSKDIKTATAFDEEKINNEIIWTNKSTIKYIKCPICQEEIILERTYL